MGNLCAVSASALTLYKFTSGKKCDSYINHRQESKDRKVHKPRNVSCPVCNETRFRSAVNAVQHVESGSCIKCRGKENAREKIYKFIATHQESRGLLAERPALTRYGECVSEVPERPYVCKSCDRTFVHLSGLMQHQEASNCSVSYVPAIGYADNADDRDTVYYYSDSD